MAEITDWFEWVTSDISNHTDEEGIDALKSTGFIPSMGTDTHIISAMQVNTVLRQANLITVALMKSLGVTGTFKDSVNTIKTAIDTAFANKVKTVKVNNATSADVAAQATTTDFSNNIYAHYSIDVSTLEPVAIPLVAGKTYHVRVYMEFVTMQQPAEVQNVVYIPSMSGNNLYIYVGEFSKDVMAIRSITAFLYTNNQGTTWKLNLALGQPEGQSSQAYPSKIDIYVKEIK